MTEGENRSGHEARVPLSALVPEAFKLTDRIARKGVEREAKLGSEIPCTEGCAACCRSLVRLQQARETLEQNGLAEALERDLVRQPGDVSYDHRLQFLSHQYLTLRLACPFLDNEICSIYSWRLITCRQYLVTSPARVVRLHCNLRKVVTVRSC